MKAKITIPNIKGYLQAHYREILKDFDFLPKHIQEQAEWRLKQVAEKSPECLEKDSCKECGCQVSSKVFEDRACEGKCYPPMMSEEEWIEFKWNLQEDNSVPGIKGTKFKIKLSKD